MTKLNKGVKGGKIILDLCGGSGAWSKPYKDAGYDVRLITLPEFDVTKFVILEATGDIAFEVDDKPYEVIPTKDIYGILAAPPCTMFSLARQTAKTPRDLKQGMKLVEACLRIIWNSQLDGHQLKFWALENPLGHLRRFLGRPPFTFQHWQFDKESLHCKPTDLWGRFNEPRISVKEKPDMDKNRNYRTGNWQKPLPPKGYEHLTKRADIRSITPLGFAKAFYEANK